MALGKDRKKWKNVETSSVNKYQSGITRKNRNKE